MTRHPILESTPAIDTLATRQLRRHVGALATRQPATGAAIVAIRAGDNDTLLALVHRVQAGEHDAALVTLGALLPRLCQVVIRRHNPHAWARSIDDYLTLGYLVILDAHDTDPATHFADKLIARTRRRHERQLLATAPIPTAGDPDRQHGPADIEHEVLARLSLSTLARGIEASVVTADNWRLLASYVEHQGERGHTSRDRQTIARTRQRLATWCQQQDAAA